MQRKSTESKPYQTSKMECFCKYFSPSHSEKLPNNLRISNYVFPRIFQLNISMPTRTFVKKHCVKSVQTRSFSGTYFPLFSQNTRKITQKKLPIWTLFTQWSITKTHRSLKLWKCFTGFKWELCSRMLKLFYSKQVQDKFNSSIF